MEKLLPKFCVFFVIVLVATSLGVFSVVYAGQVTAKDRARVFIENVLPVDLSKYDVVFVDHSTMDGVPINGTDGQPIDVVIDHVRYFLVSEESKLRVNFGIKNDAVSSCHIYVDEGDFISDKSYANLTEAVKGLLGRYQSHTKIDSRHMMAMLDNVDVSRDSTLTMDNIKLVVSHIEKYGIKQTSFNWIYTVNRADYDLLPISYRNGRLFDICDNRPVYTIGDTSINVSREQAIDIAMKHLQFYSYDVPNDVTISDFNITEDRTTAELKTYPIYFQELRPYWNVKLYLNQTYPGSVHGFSVLIWANSGEPFTCTNIAFGGIGSDDSSNLPTQSSNEDISLVLIAGLVVSATLLLGAAMYIRKIKH